MKNQKGRLKMFSFEKLKGRLIVSCQALPDEPLHSAFIMGRMALAAKEGGACAIRAQGMADIIEIKEVTGLPVFGIVKRDYEDSGIYITPTAKEVRELLAVGVEVIGLDMTARRPHGEKMVDSRSHMGAAPRYSRISRRMREGWRRCASARTRFRLRSLAIRRIRRSFRGRMSRSCGALRRIYRCRSSPRGASIRRRACARSWQRGRTRLSSAP